MSRYLVVEERQCPGCFGAGEVFVGDGGKCPDCDGGVIRSGISLADAIENLRRRSDDQEKLPKDCL